MLLALAGRESDEGLLRYAATLSRMLDGLETHCLHVTAPGVAVERVQDVTAELRGRAAAHLPTAVCHVASGDLLDCILGFAGRHGVDLILLGHAPERSPRRFLARRLAMNAPCSVWMVPDGAAPRIGKVLAPVDFSSRSADSLDVATALAEAAGLDECLALHVHFNDAAVSYDEFDEDRAGEEEGAFSLFVAPVNLHGVFAKPLFVESPHVAPAILRTAAAEGADLIVMGTRGRSPSAAILLGSETEHALTSTPVPFLAVKHFGARRRLLQVLRDQRVLGRADEHYT